MEHIINETQNFLFIKFDGQQLYNSASTNQDAKLAIKELRLFKRLINSEKKNINNQLRAMRARVANLKASTSLPIKSLSWVRFGIRAVLANETQPLEDSKTFYNNILLQCDRIQYQLEQL